MHHSSAEEIHAGTEDTRAGAPGRARGEGAVDAGRRIRSRGDGAHSRGEAWRALHQTGDRDRLVEGETCGRQAACAEAWQGQGRYANTGRARFAPRELRDVANALKEAVAGHAPRVEEGEPIGRRGWIALQTGDQCGAQALS